MRAPCSIDGCEKQSRGRGWCSTHWRRWRTHGDPLKVLRPGVDFMTKVQCSVEDCDHLAHAHSYCSMHLRRWELYGDPHGRGTIGRPLKGEQPTWGAVHKRLQRERGRACEHRCVDCGRPAQEWSYDRTDPDQLIGPCGRFQLAYSLDVARYVPRCVRCHRRFDRLEQPGALIRIDTLDQEGRLS